MCAPHAEGWPSVHGIPKGLLDLALYRHILDGLVADDCRFDHVIFQWLGDPTLHPQFEELLILAADRLQDRVGYLRFDSNGILLTPERSLRLLEGLGDVPLVAVFTLDAVAEGTYLATKGREGLARARQNIRAFLQARRSLGRSRVSVQVQFVVQPTNWFEAGEFRRYWEDVYACHGAGGYNEILYKRLSVGGGASGQAMADALYERTISTFGIHASEASPAVRTWEDRPWQRDDAHSRRSACPGPWYTPVIRQDGHLLVCCSDLHGDLDLGSLATSGFLELWLGAKARALRAAHLQGRFDGACATCGGINWYALDPAQVARLEGARPTRP
jgi:hypothetical protein